MKALLLLFNKILYYFSMEDGRLASVHKSWQRLKSGGGVREKEETYGLEEWGGSISLQSLISLLSQ